MPVKVSMCTWGLLHVVSSLSHTVSYVHTHIHMHTQTHTHMHTHTHTCTHTHKHTHTHTRTHTHTLSHTHTHTFNGILSTLKHMPTSQRVSSVIVRISRKEVCIVIIGREWMPFWVVTVAKVILVVSTVEDYSGSYQ